MIADEKITEIQQSANIVDVISGFLPLKRSGSIFKTRCPFHNEKTPSFIVNPAKQIFKCFGCGKGGNVFSFVMAYERMGFVEAVRLLANKYGITIKYSKKSKEKTKNKNKIYEVNKWAVDYFHKELLSSNEGLAAKQYLEKRGFNLGVIKKFRIGYCPRKDTHNELYLPFKGRVVFPIFDLQDRPVGFGGRALDDKIKPKYINSSETPVFQKRMTLYALNFAKRNIIDTSNVLIFEGYTDVIMAYQNGIKNTVATLGTSLTKEHVKALKRYTDNATIIFDSDTAGQRASEKAIDLFVQGEVGLKIACLPEDKDPFDFILNKGKEDFLEYIKNAKNCIDFKIDLAMKKYNIDTINGKATAIDYVLRTIMNISNPVLQSLSMNRITELLNVEKKALIQRLETL